MQRLKQIHSLVSGWATEDLFISKQIYMVQNSYLQCRSHYYKDFNSLHNVWIVNTQKTDHSNLISDYGNALPSLRGDHRRLIAWRAWPCFTVSLRQLAPFSQWQGSSLAHWLKCCLCVCLLEIGLNSIFNSFILCLIELVVAMGPKERQKWKPRPCGTPGRLKQMLKDLKDLK
jgi:hypothetical protein